MTDSNVGIWSMLVSELASTFQISRSTRLAFSDDATHHEAFDRLRVGNCDFRSYGVPMATPGYEHSRVDITGVFQNDEAWASAEQAAFYRVMAVRFMAKSGTLCSVSFGEAHP